jgi:Ca-activated chloride channel family protein
MPPALVIALIVVALIVVAYFAGLRPAPVRGRRPAPVILRRRSKWRKVLPIIPLLAAVACLVFAFTGFGFNVAETSPVIVLVMDVSDSMHATDVDPNRLEASQAAAEAFLDELPPRFQVGLVTFAGEAKIVVDPTRVREDVEEALERFTTSKGTVIGDGLTVALDAIEDVRDDAPDTPAAALLLSDGRDTGSTVSPDGAAARAASMEVPVSTVVIGVEAVGGGPGANRDALEAIAEASGGETSTAETADELTRSFESIGSRLSVELDVESSTTPWVIAAIALTILAGLMLVYTPR